MTKLAQSDEILRAKPGEWLMACAPVSGVNMRAGGKLSYAIGARFRVKFAAADLIWCLDEDARSVTFDREAMADMERRQTDGG